MRYAAGGTISAWGGRFRELARGPLAALMGNGVTVMIARWESELAGTWVYGFLRPRSRIESL